MTETPALSDDILRGMEAIARELGVTRKQVWHMARTTNIPIFRIGILHCARRSTLTLWIAAMEYSALRRLPDPKL